MPLLIFVIAFNGFEQDIKVPGAHIIVYMSISALSTLLWHILKLTLVQTHLGYVCPLTIM